MPPAKKKPAAKKKAKAAKKAATHERWGGKLPPWLQKAGAALPLDDIKAKAIELVKSVAAKKLHGIDKHGDAKKQLKTFLDDVVFNDKLTKAIAPRIMGIPIPIGEVGTDALIEMLDGLGLLDRWIADAYAFASDAGEL